MVLIQCSLWQAGIHEAGRSLVSCTTSSHCSAPGKTLQKLLSSPHKSLMSHPCSNHMEKRQEMKNLPGTSNSSQPLLLHGTLLQGHVYREKRLSSPFVSCLWCSHSSSPLPTALPEFSPSTQGKGCLDRIPGPAPINGIVPKGSFSSGT